MFIIVNHGDRHSFCPKLLCTALPHKLPRFFVVSDFALFLLFVMCKHFFLSFKDGADLRIESFSCMQSLHTLSPDVNGFTFCFVFNFHTRSLTVVEVLLCSNLKDDLCKLNLVLNLFSHSPI